MSYLPLDIVSYVEVIPIIIMTDALEAAAVERYEALAEDDAVSNNSSSYLTAATHPLSAGPLIPPLLNINTNDTDEHRNPHAERPLTLDNVERAIMTFINRGVSDELFRACIGLGGVLPPSFEPGVLEDLLHIWRGRVDGRFDIHFAGHSVAPFDAYVRLPGARAPPPSPAPSLHHPQDTDDDEELFRLLAYICAAAGVAPQVFTPGEEGQYPHTSVVSRQGSESEGEFDFQGEWGSEGSGDEGSNHHEGREVIIHPCASDEAEDGSTYDE